MNKLKKTFSLRKKKDLSVDENHEDDWQEDELRVRRGRCSFLLEVSISSIIRRDLNLACDHAFTSEINKILSKPNWLCGTSISLVKCYLNIYYIIFL